MDQNAKTDDVAPSTGALGEAERPADSSHRSGIRMSTQEDAPATDDFVLDPYNAVTRVQEAVDLEALLPATAATVAVSDTITVGDAAPAPSPPQAKQFFPALVQLPSEEPTLLTPLHLLHGAPPTEADASPPAHSTREYPAPSAPAPSRSRNGKRKGTLALVVVALLLGASALLVVLARQGIVHAPGPAEHFVQRAVQLVR
jgi:hypothetical protein